MRRSFEETGPLLVPDLLAMAFIVGWGLYWLAPELGHPSIHNWDESFHQTVARGTAEHFPVPTMYEEPMYPLVLRYWWESGVWLHKAAGVFWWAAIVIKLFGVTTAALRSASLVAQLATAVMTYLLARPLAGRPLAFFGPLAFLAMPWSWFMTQGHFVADVTDLTVTSFVALSMMLLWACVEKGSGRLAALAGAAVGLAYLCKTFLALGPLGVAGVWWLLARVGFCKGPTFKQLLLVAAGFVVVAAPWNLYAFFKWHDVYMRAFDHTLGFVSATSGEDVGSGARPPDAIFHEINFTILKPIPYPFTFLCGVWLAVKAVRDRDGRLVAIALWLWSTWVVHSFTNVKGHGHLWNVLPAVFIAYAVTLRDAWRLRPLGAAVVASLVVYELHPQGAFFASLREKLPAFMVQAKSWPLSNTVEQAVLVPLAVIAVWLLGVAFKRQPKLLSRLALGFGALATFGSGVYAFPRSFDEQKKQWAAMDHDRHWSSTEDVGRALDQSLERRSMFFMDTNADFGTSFEYQSLMFWTGRMCYRRSPDVPTAQAHGYHPYLVSPSDEAFEPLPQVPAFASLRAYDLLKPLAAPAALPAGLTPLDQTLRTLKVMGWSARALDERWSRYAFYVAPIGMPSDAAAIFHLDDGTTTTQPLPIQSTLRTPDRLAGHAWFVLPAVGPPHARVKAIELQQ